MEIRWLTYSCKDILMPRVSRLIISKCVHEAIPSETVNKLSLSSHSSRLSMMTNTFLRAFATSHILSPSLGMGIAAFGLAGEEWLQGGLMGHAPPGHHAHNRRMQGVGCGLDGCNDNGTMMVRRIIVSKRVKKYVC